MPLTRRTNDAVRSALLFFLLLLATPATAQAPLDTQAAERQLEALEAQLGARSVSERQVGEAQRVSTRLRTQASTCIRDGEALIERLRSDRRLLGEPTEDDPAEIIEQRTAYEVEIKREEARVGRCRLLQLNAEQVLDQAAALQRSLSARRLSSSGDSFVDAVVALVDSPGDHLRSLRRALYDAGALHRFTVTGWVLTVLAMIAAAGLGFLARQRSLAWCDAQSPTGDGMPTAQTTLTRLAAPQLPLLLAGTTALMTLLLYAEAPRQELVLVRLALALVALAASQALVHWYTGHYSPGGHLTAAEPEVGRETRKRVLALLLGLLAGYVAFGDDWLGAMPEARELLLRDVLSIYVGAATIWVLRLPRVITSLSSFLLLPRLLLAMITLVAVAADLTGFHNLANYLLIGVLATMGASLTLWTLLWAMRRGVHATLHGTSSAAYRMRAWLGVRQDETSAEIGWLYLITSVVLWAGFLALIVWVWDTTGNALPMMAEFMREGISLGEEARIVPSHVLIGLVAFGVTIAVTAWLKARLNKRWLRDMGMDRHAREALVAVTGYTGFTVAALTGLTMAGVSFSGLAIVFGALSVGIGFGLRDIVNNFVSGLILLFERPIKAGDFVSVGIIEGFVREVRMRATEIETLDRRNVLVPNSELVSTQVTNWVLRDPHGRLLLRVNVAFGTDTAKVVEVLEQVAADHPETITSGRVPAPRCLFMGYGEHALEFELRVWIRNIEKRFIATSDLYLAIDKALREHNIVVPYPQRDLHVRSWAAQPSSAAPPTDEAEGPPTPREITPPAAARPSEERPQAKPN